MENRKLQFMANGVPQRIDVGVVREIDLGRHHLVLLSDQSIEVLTDEQAHSAAGHMLSLDACETYCLLISLQEWFKETTV